MNTQELLQKLGMGKRESEIYLTLLESGPQLPQHIARNTGIKRTTLYEIFPEMIATGLISDFSQGKRRLFQATAPKFLLERYEKRYKEIKNNITELTSIYRMQGLRPKVEMFEGYEGIKKLYMRTLEEKEEILSFMQVTKFNEKVVDWLQHRYVPMRVKKGICVRAIIPKKDEPETIMPHGKEYMRKTRSVPWDKFPFRIEGLVQDNRIFFATYEKGGPLVGIIIESKQIADTQKALFNLAWEGAEKYQ